MGVQVMNMAWQYSVTEVSRVDLGDGYFEVTEIHRPAEAVEVEVVRIVEPAPATQTEGA